MVVEATLSSSIPPWLRRFLQREGADAIAEAVRAEERTTSVEFVTLVAQRSIAVGHVFPLILLSLWLVYVASSASQLMAPWRGVSVWWSLFDLTLLAAVAWFLAKRAPVRRLLTAAADVEVQVKHRAQYEFSALNVARTREATGILLFVSLTERRAVVLVDRKIAAILPTENWAHVVLILTDGLRRGDLALGMIDAIRRCSRLVQPHFPPLVDDRNELDDALLIKD